MKNYGFERMGIFEHSSGMIFFDRDLAERLAGYDENGKPFIRLSDGAKIVLATYGIRDVQINISHTDDVCTAVCVMQ